MIEVTAVLDDGTVETYRIDASELVFVRTAEEVAAAVARDAFIDELHALLVGHGVKLVGDGYDGWPYFRGAFGEVNLTEWWDYDE